MWVAVGQTLQMTEHDFGVELPITIGGVTFTEHDSVLFTLKKAGETILTRDFSNITHNTVNLSITEAESGSLPVGNYVYTLDWYQDGVFLCNIVPAAAFKVVDKA